MPARAKKQLHHDYFRSMIFGTEDALVSTTGVVVGMTVGAPDQKTVILAGLVAVAVEALSMGAGQYLSQDAVEEMQKNKSGSRGRSVISAIIMFVSYFIAGIIPVAPLFMFEGATATKWVFIFAFTGLFVLGYGKGRFLGISSVKSAVKMLVVGGLAAFIGVLVGMQFRV